MRSRGAVVKALTSGSVQTNNGLQLASDDFRVMTNKGLVSSAIFSALIAVIGLIFFALFLWKRKTLDPPSYIDVEKGDKPEKGPAIAPGEESPELPIQHAEKASPSPEEDDDPLEDYHLYTDYRGSLADRKRGHSRSGSDASSMTANDSAYSLYRETLQKRALLTNSVSSFDSTCRDSTSDFDSRSSTYSGSSRYSQVSERRITVNNVRMPPQFVTPMPPPSVVGQRY